MDEVLTQSEVSQRMSKLVCEKLGLDPGTVTGWTAENDGGDDVAIEVKVYDTMTLNEFNELLRQAREG